MFEKLPDRLGAIPAQHFDVIQHPRPIIPWGEYGADLAKTIGEAFKNLSPEERQRKKLEMDILGARDREANMHNELLGLQLANYKQSASNAATHVNRNNSIISEKLGTEASPDMPSTFSGGPPLDDGEPDTSPHEYYNEPDDGTQETGAGL